MSARDGHFRLWVNKADHEYKVRETLQELEELSEITDLDENGYPVSIPYVDRYSKKEYEQTETGYSLVHSRDLTKLINQPDIPSKAYQFTDPDNSNRVFAPIEPQEISIDDLLIHRSHLEELGIPDSPANIKTRYIEGLCKNNLLPEKIDQACFLYFSYFYGKSVRQEPSIKALKAAIKKSKQHRELIDPRIIDRVYSLCATLNGNHRKSSVAELCENRAANTMLIDFAKLPAAIQATIDVYYEFWSMPEQLISMQQPKSTIINRYIKDTFPGIEGRQLQAIISTARPNSIPKKPPHRHKPFYTRSEQERRAFGRINRALFGATQPP